MSINEFIARRSGTFMDNQDAQSYAGDQEPGSSLLK